MRLRFAGPGRRVEGVDAAGEEDAEFELQRVGVEIGGVFQGFLDVVAAESEETGRAVVSGAEVEGCVFAVVGFEREGEASGKGGGAGGGEVAVDFVAELGRELREEETGWRGHFGFL